MKNKPVFPIVSGGSVGHFGMSTRQLVGAMALQGMLSNMEFLKINADTAKQNGDEYDSFLSMTALLLADEFLKQEEETR
jgi:hypothetical protein